MMFKRNFFILPPTKILLLPQESLSKEAEGDYKGSQPLISLLSSKENIKLILMGIIEYWHYKDLGKNRVLQR